jgi:heat shock protein HslJ
MKILFSLFTLILFTESCNSSKKTIEQDTIENKNMVQNSISGNYTIMQIGDNTSISPKLFISFDEKSSKVNGFAGCNSFFGAFSSENVTISFSDISSSKKLCPKPITDIENQFIKALKAVNSFTIKDNRLLLLENDKPLIIATKTKSSESKSETIKKSAIVKNNYGTQITYQITSRGQFENIQISKNEILVAKDRSLNVRRQYICEQQDWEALNSMIEATNLEIIPKLESPSNKHSTDAALSATFAIQVGDVEYRTVAFDHGNPPEEIKALVNKVLSIKENVVKQ